MKRIYIAIILIIMTLVLSYIQFNVINNSYIKITNMISDTQIKVNAGYYEVAKENCKTIIKTWEKDRKALGIFLSHSYINNITDNLNNMMYHVNIKDKEKFNDVCDKTKRQLLFLQKSELPVIENIM